MTDTKDETTTEVAAAEASSDAQQSKAMETDQPVTEQQTSEQSQQQQQQNGQDVVSVKQEDDKSADTSTNVNGDESNLPKLFVGRLPMGTKDTELKELFSAYGEVNHCDIVGKYGFVHMKNKEDAENAMKNLNNHTLNGNNITVQFSTSTSRKNKKNKQNRAKKSNNDNNNNKGNTNNSNVNNNSGNSMGNNSGTNANNKRTNNNKNGFVQNKKLNNNGPNRNKNMNHHHNGNHHQNGGGGNNRNMNGNMNKMNNRGGRKMPMGGKMPFHQMGRPMMNRSIPQLSPMPGPGPTGYYPNNQPPPPMNYYSPPPPMATPQMTPAIPRDMYGYNRQNDNSYYVRSNGPSSTPMYGQPAMNLSPVQQPSSGVYGGYQSYNRGPPTPMNKMSPLSTPPVPHQPMYGQMPMGPLNPQPMAHASGYQPMGGGSFGNEHLPNSINNKFSTRNGFLNKTRGNNSRYNNFNRGNKQRVSNMNGNN